MILLLLLLLFVPFFNFSSLIHLLIYLVQALKKETLDIVLAELKANGDKVATYKGVPFTTSAGVCTVKTIANGGIR